MLEIKLLPDLFPEAHRIGEGALLRVWYLARTVTTDPRRLSRQDLLTACVKYLNIKERYANILLDKGDGLWWNLDTKHDLVYLIGAKPIAARLGVVAHRRSENYLLPIEKLGRLKVFYAANYAAYMQRYTHNDKSYPVSRQVLLERFGVVLNTLRSWEKEAGVIVVENWAFARPQDLCETPNCHVEFHCNCGRAFNSFEKYTNHRAGKNLYGEPEKAPCAEKEYSLVWNRANSYIAPATSTVGTASPICASRMTHYSRRQGHRHLGAKGNAQPRSTTLSTQPGAQVDEAPTGMSYKYCKVKASDPVPYRLQEIDRARLSRAVKSH